jgi:glycine/D-amino acid oxidase-like deaminating enzyme
MNKRKSVAVIGAGIAGLTAAYYLARNGHLGWTLSPATATKVVALVNNYVN